MPPAASEPGSLDAGLASSIAAARRQHLARKDPIKDRARVSADLFRNGIEGGCLAAALIFDCCTNHTASIGNKVR